MKYRSEIDGLRAIAVIPVILFHAEFTSFSGGFVGVDIFFVISGYLITTIILSEMEQGSFSLVNFYERRARRILPPLFLVMLVSLPFAWLWLYPSALRGFARSLVAVSSFSSNILFWLESGYWEPINELKPLLHTWSLAVEEQYYVIFPLFLMLMWRYRKRWILSSFMLIVGVSFFIAHWGAYYEPNATFYLLPTRAWELAIGASIAFYLMYRKKTIQTLLSYRVADEILGLVGLVMIGYAIFVFNEETPFPSLYLVPTIGAGMIIMFSTLQTMIGRLLSSKPLVIVGLISYSAYLWHQPLIAFTHHRVLNESSELILTVSVIITFPLAYLTYKYVETPFRSRKLVSRKTIYKFSVAGTLIFISIGMYVYFSAYDISYYATEKFIMRKEMIDELGSRRQQFINAGICQYNKRGRYKKLDDFINNWSCLSDDEEGFISSKIGVFGDSHSADKAIMLRMNQLDVLQLGGAGCPLLPSKRTECNRLLMFFHDVAHENSIDTVLISNYFDYSELDSNYLQKIFNYWGSKYNNIILFSPMVQFPDWKKIFLRSGVYEFHPEFNDHNRFFESIKNTSIPNNVLILDTRKLFCDDINNCSALDDNGKLLLTDADHLSEFGAKKLGKKLLEQLPLR